MIVICVYSQYSAEVNDSSVIYSSVITFRKAVSVSSQCSTFRFFIKVMFHSSFGWDVAAFPSCNLLR